VILTAYHACLKTYSVLSTVYHGTYSLIFDLGLRYFKFFFFLQKPYGFLFTIKFSLYVRSAVLFCAYKNIFLNYCHAFEVSGQQQILDLRENDGRKRTTISSSRFQIPSNRWRASVLLSEEEGLVWSHWPGCYQGGGPQ